MSLTAALHRVVSASTDPRPLAATRVLLGAAALLKLMDIAGPVMELAGGGVRVPFFSGLGYPPPVVMYAGMLVWAGAGLGVLVGWRTRGSAAVLTTVMTCALLVDQQLYGNHLYLLCVLTFLLALADSGASFSLDARRREPSICVTAWPVVLLQAMVPIVYGFAALAKVNLYWLSGGLLSTALRTEGPLVVPEALRVVSVMAPLAWVTVLVEAALAVAFFSPRWRRKAVLLGVGLHLSILGGIDEIIPLVVFTLAMFALYPLFFGFAQSPQRPWLASLETAKRETTGCAPASAMTPSTTSASRV